jgi:peptide/nickel transport system substrate-binding protein
MTGQFRSVFRLGAVLAGVVAGGAVWTAAHAQDLAIASSAPVTSMDPHYHTLGPNASAHVHFYERLVARNAAGDLGPSLAVSWRLIDDTTWEFKLRPAKFHNGAPLTADDIAYSINRVPKVKNSPASFQIYTRAVVGHEIVDPLTIRLKTATPYPLLAIDLSQIFIIPRSLGDEPATEDFNSGKNAIGTGPYRFVSYSPGERIEMERNEEYWGPKPHWKKVDYRIISNDGARTASLLAGDVGIIEFVPPQDLPNLRKDPRVSISEVVSNRSIFLWYDHSREGPTPFVTGPNGETLAKNPFKDRRVRLALSLAINRQGIVERVMENSAVPTGQYLRPGAFTYVPDLKPHAYDPEKAKALLKEAGYPNGLRVTIHGPNNRYVNDAKIIQAVAQMWQRIGVQTTVDAIPWSNFIARAGKQEFSVFLLGWGVSSGEGMNPLRAQIATWNPQRGLGTANRGRYSNPAIDTLIDQAMATMNDGARDKLVQQAMRMAMEDVPVIQLHLQKNIWATRKDLTYEARVDEDTQAMGVKPTK